MRLAYKIFAWTFLFVFVDSLVYNLNMIQDYWFFPKEINQTLFGLSYIVPLNVFGFIMYIQAKFSWEKIVVAVYLWFTTSALADELFFDPYKPGVWEHVAGLLILIIVYYYERFKKARD